MVPGYQGNVSRRLLAFVLSVVSGGNPTQHPYKNRKVVTAHDGTLHNDAHLHRPMMRSDIGADWLPNVTATAPGNGKAKGINIGALIGRALSTANNSDHTAALDAWLLGSNHSIADNAWIAGWADITSSDESTKVEQAMKPRTASKQPSGVAALASSNAHLAQSADLNQVLNRHLTSAEKFVLQKEAESHQVDVSINCAGWATHGECARNPRYMLHYCAKSCARQR
eukprot:gnl/MRDRNA2_/MRDRNA2_143603_c0_seq1.p1 gnl/MRDRNA2_/MRDRNA2_143603_c0~~gnl/MRDRNA2_/MRDRNA2_143603_c0_seq1.p1  ORF type:complete len:226 (+),score=27.57 gnl/MRDRNA2_/MRDRNA2_143603_c0_seq1:152-829(+)